MHIIEKMLHCTKHYITALCRVELNRNILLNSLVEQNNFYECQCVYVRAIIMQSVVTLPCHYM